MGHKNKALRDAWILPELKYQPEYGCPETWTWNWDLVCVFSQKEFSPCLSLLIAEGM